jgi:type I restriction enzyme S subunit
MQDRQIPEGYKDSPLGIIPKEWTVKKLGEILASTRLGGNYENAESHKGIPVIKMGNIERGNISVEKILYLPEGSLYNREDVLNVGDLLLNTRNTLELVGKVAIWRNELPLAIYNSNLLRMQFKRECICSDWYMNYSFNSYSSIKQLRRYATGTTSVAAIYSRDLFNLKIALPSLSEQQKITEILSVWDEAIEKQNQLIAKLETRKCGLMQQLFFGKKRFNGFSETWQEYRLGNFFKERNETKFDYLPLLSVGQEGIYLQTSSDKKDISNDDKSKYKRICIGDIGYNTMRMWQGRSALSQLEGIISPAYTVVIPQKQANSLFFSYLFKSPKVMNLFWRNSQGLVDDTLNCKYKDFSLVKINIPIREEQTAIANILSDADNYIDLAKQKLAKLKEQKKGLMQVLLTGKKRVTV